MNSPVDPALLQLFQKELNSLHDVVSMAAETKEEEMKICHEIQNIVICVEEMKQRIEKLEMGHVNTLHQTEQIENRVTNLEGKRLLVIQQILPHTEMCNHRGYLWQMVK